MESGPGLSSSQAFKSHDETDNNYALWQFSIRPIYSLIMILGIAICVGAAIWQYNKAQHYVAPVEKSLRIQGQYLNQHHFFLDNQTLNGKAGYHVISPFLFEGEVYLVNRGFIAYENRESLPSVKDVSGLVVIQGRLDIYRKPLLLNEKIDPIKNRIQFIDLQAIANELNKPVFKKIFILEKGEGLLQLAPKQAPYLSHHKHMAYALQWILLALAGFVILLIASVKKGSDHD